jgi:hypothetical protein
MGCSRPSGTQRPRVRGLLALAVLATCLQQNKAQGESPPAASAVDAVPGHAQQSHSHVCMVQQGLSCPQLHACVRACKCSCSSNGATDCMLQGCSSRVASQSKHPQQAHPLPAAAVLQVLQARPCSLTQAPTPGLHPQGSHLSVFCVLAEEVVLGAMCLS